MRFLTLLFLLLAACAAPAPQPAPAPAMEDTETCSAEYNAARRCAARIEERRMAAAGGLAARSGDTLRIRGTGGDTLRLVNDAAEGGHFRYDRYLPEIGFHVVQQRFHEGGSWLLVDARTTGQTRVIGPPVVSPGRTRFAAASLDLLPGYDPNGVQVWRLGEGGPRLEWGIDGGGQWGAAGPSWASEDVLHFTRADRPNAPNTPVTFRRMRLTLSPDELTIRPAPR
ncbi:MAG TPA: hypothetical protein VGB96_04140 [Archangium sp.]|jgi:hypothetical protein